MPKKTARGRQKAPKEKNSLQSDRDTEAELFKRIRAMLDDIQPTERVGLTAPGKKSSMETIPVAIRIPKTLDEKLKKLDGPKSRHIERAIMLYLKAMQAGAD